MSYFRTSRFVWRPLADAIICAATSNLLLAFIGSGAEARKADCSRATSHIERQICSTADLRALDAALERLYVEVRGSSTPSAQKALIRQQAQWLAKRNETCTDAKVSCLQSQYQGRLDQLRALDARLIDGSKLDDVTSVIMRGNWRVGAVLDPEGAGAPASPDINETLLLADLPAPGTVVTGKPGQICYSKSECRPIGWSVDTLADEIGGERLAAALKFRLQTRVYVGFMNPRAALLAVQAPDRHLLVNFAICGPEATGCRNGFEDWAPDQPDSRMEVFGLRSKEPAE